VSLEKKSFLFQQNEVLKKMRKYLFLILIALLVLIFFYFLINIYLLTKLSVNSDNDFQARDQYEFNENSTKFSGNLDISLLHSKYRTRNPRIDLVRDKILKTFKACELDGLNFKTIWSEVDSVS
jgi:hypothetical protein